MTNLHKLAAAVGRYGGKAVKYVWDHKGTILGYIERGFPLAWLIDYVLDRV